MFCPDCVLIVFLWSWLRIVAADCSVLTAQGSRAQQSRLVVREGPGLDMRRRRDCRGQARPGLGSKIIKACSRE